MKFEFEVKGLKLGVEGELPDAVVKVLGQAAEIASEALAELKAEQFKTTVDQTK